ncbi:hypothetical protein ACFLT2_02070 [Acidobacteriota bacterium]
MGKAYKIFDKKIKETIALKLIRSEIATYKNVNSHHLGHPWRFDSAVIKHYLIDESFGGGDIG